MHDMITRIEQAEADELHELLKAVLRRYAVLFPDWEVSTFSVHRCADRNEQIDRIIRVLQNRKTDDG